MTQLRIGIFGGTFDPVHQGHLEVATRVRSRLSLDWVEFVPAYLPPHKQGLPEASAWHRYAMLILATNESQGVLVSTIELDTLDSVYTIDTIRRLKLVWDQRAEFYCIIGADSFEDIITWKDYELLLDSCHFAVVTRPGYSLRARHLPETIRRRIVDLRQSDHVIEVSGEYRIYLCGDISVPISSTAIRQAVKEGRPVEGVIPAVHHHIEKYQLYRDADEAKTDEASFTRAGRLG